MSRTGIVDGVAVIPVIASGYHIYGILACPVVRKCEFQRLVNLWIAEFLRSDIGRIECLFVQLRIMPAAVGRTEQMSPAISLSALGFGPELVGIVADDEIIRIFLFPRPFIPVAAIDDGLLVLTEFRIRTPRVWFRPYPVTFQLALVQRVGHPHRIVPFRVIAG